MPYKVAQDSNGDWCVFKENADKSLGKMMYNHGKDKAKAEAQMRALYASESKQNTAGASIVEHNGRRYMVVPGVPVREGVMKNYFVSAKEIIRSMPAWNATPLTLYHPKENGGSARVPAPDSPIIGFFYNAGWDKSRNAMTGEYWIDITEAEKYEDGKAILNMVSNGQMIETSTGYWSDDIYQKGSFNNRNYDLLHVNLLPDHIAVLPKQIGACSIKDGCGVNRNTVNQNCDCSQCPAAPTQNEQALEDLEVEIRQSFGSAFNKPNDTSAPTYQECYVEKIFPGYVIARKDGKLYRVPFTMGQDGILFSGTQNWEPVEIQYISKNESLPAYQAGYLPTAILFPYTFNKGSRTPEQLAALRAFIQANGITKPVFIMWCDENIKIMDGNHRVAMAYELGIDQIPVKIMNDDGEDVDPEIVYRKYQHEEDQGYLGANPSGEANQNSFPDHEGRPGQVGGSKARGAGSSGGKFTSDSELANVSDRNVNYFKDMGTALEKHGNNLKLELDNGKVFWLSMTKDRKLQVEKYSGGYKRGTDTLDITEDDYYILFTRKQSSKNQARQNQNTALKQNPRRSRKMDLKDLLLQLQERGIRVTTNDNATEFQLDETPGAVGDGMLSAEEITALKSLAKNSQDVITGLGDIATLAKESRARAEAEKATLIMTIKSNSANTFTDDELAGMGLSTLAKIAGTVNVNYAGALGGQSLFGNSDVPVLLPAPAMLTAKPAGGNNE